MAVARAPRQLQELRRDAGMCTNCELYERATQTVFGEGPADARLVLVGEQPGDHEDLEGHVFVGPAGRVLDRALAAADIPRDQVYLTNAVKHFNWRPAGKARIHKKPAARHIRACAPWWEAELAIIRPDLVCCLGAVAAQALLGAAFRVTRQRGELLTSPSGVPAIATVHPSAVLRADDRDAAFAGLVHDLETVRHVLDTVGGDDPARSQSQ